MTPSSTEGNPNGQGRAKRKSRSQETKEGEDQDNRGSPKPEGDRMATELRIRQEEVGRPALAVRDIDRKNAFSRRRFIRCRRRIRVVAWLNGLGVPLYSLPVMGNAPQVASPNGDRAVSGLRFLWTVSPCEPSDTGATRKSSAHEPNDADNSTLTSSAAFQGSPLSRPKNTIAFASDLGARGGTPHESCTCCAMRPGKALEYPE